MYKTILIINPFGIGDVLFTTPLVRAIKKSLPNSFIGYWCNLRTKDILKDNPRIDKIFALSRGDLKKIYRQSFIKGTNIFLSLLGQIKKESFDIALDFSLDHRYSLIAKLSGIKKRIGFNFKNRGRFLTERIDIESYKDKHVVEYYLDMLRFLDIGQQEKPETELFLSREDELFADGFLKAHDLTNDGILIGCAPAGGTSWGGNADYLRWPQQKFASLIDCLIKKHNVTILLFGAPEEADICNRIQSNVSGNVINTAGKITLGEFAALFKRCKIAVCNDAGPLHIAVALGVKTVSICGPVDPRVYGPYPQDQKKHIILKKDLTCSPCYRNFHFNACEKNKECLQSIGIEQAQEAVSRLLS